MRTQVAVLCAAGAVAGAHAGVAQAQQYPAKPVRIIVSTVPGPLDAYARLVVEKMSSALKQPFVVENRPGAGGNIAADLVAKSAADGYTVLFAIDTTFTVNPSIYRSLPFDPDKDFSAVSVPVTYGQMLAVHPSVPANSIGELIALAKQKKLNYASGGKGTPSHLTFAYFLATTGADINHIPYKGTGQSIVDVVGGQVESIFAVTTGVLPHVKSGRLRALGVSSAQRSPLAPEVPTVAESGFQNFDAAFAYAVMAPPRTPKEIIDTLSREIRAAHRLADLQEKNRQFDYVATDMDPQQSAAWLRERREHWARVVQKAGIVAE
jgi:tripartite-type tricarboxylate transporter receptor subunit TctC